MVFGYHHVFGPIVNTFPFFKWSAILDRLLENQTDYCKTRPFEYWASKSLVFKSFRFSSIGIQIPTVHLILDIQPFRAKYAFPIKCFKWKKAKVF